MVEKNTIPLSQRERRLSWSLIQSLTSPTVSFGCREDINSDNLIGFGPFVVWVLSMENRNIRDAVISPRSPACIVL
ncbi:hypothetical protein ASPWEDRAFT_43352 [Aspergillus wentii DTO 134E9]|uniref:Uncharacterized protein n=1 Tax=Aspergillus wentii DTO 134E9 TaxID=1073089 RepID=A0A1L9REH7_ASPWE|nr:uncharacterized protein ASPWEDRAFT_43352 [Aspergillus wentii DTO 134E9]OJJ33273.1 hypothetical protein ASPWEDRAFT_43352 [Aspergillus wentii DTO 134E9]